LPESNSSDDDDSQLREGAMTGVVRILALSGSLRQRSYNTAALRAARRLAPSGMSIDIADIAAIPLFNEDLEAAGQPPQVGDLEQHVARADALLLACPEYNHSYTAVVKNALDWLSRTRPDASHERHVLDGKPVALLGASIGRSGSGRAQLALRQTLSYLNCYLLNAPEVLIDRAQDKFDADGALTDNRTSALIRAFLDEFAAWVNRLGPTSTISGYERPAPGAHVTRAGQGAVYAVAGDCYTVKAGTAQTGGAYAAFEFFIPPGGGPPPHIHAREYEGFYLLDGELTFYVGPQRDRVVARRGDFIAAPVGVLHQFCNESDSPATAFVIAAPSGVENFFAAAGEPLPEGSTDTHPPDDDDIARLTALAPRWGIAIEQSGAVATG
jgi:chromate reductase, NAD(P)H dehydrogenase (quinone)